jgi:DNA-binding NarL/FixJ family response regulator
MLRAMPLILLLISLSLRQCHDYLPESFDCGNDLPTAFRSFRQQTHLSGEALGNAGDGLYHSGMETHESRSTADRVRLFLLAGQALFRASLGRLLSSVPDFDLVGESAIDGAALELLRGSAVDVALLEFDPDTEQAREFMAEAVKSGYSGRFFVITATLDARDSARAVQLGASGIFLKSDSAERLVHAVRAVARGEMWVDPQVIRLLADRYPLEPDHIDGGGLTERERRVLMGILGGLSNRKIGEDIMLSESSVKAVVQQLFEKTGVRTRSQLVRIAISHSLDSAVPIEASKREIAAAKS